MKRLFGSLLTLSVVSVGSSAIAQSAASHATEISAYSVINQGPPPGGRQPGFGPQFGRGPTEEEKERFRIRIGISKEQQAAIDNVFRESDQQMTEVRTRSMDLSNQLYNLYDIYDFDRAQAQSIRRDLLKLHKRMADIHADNEERFRHIMTREQFEKMRTLVREERDKRRRAWEDQHKRGPGAPGRP